MIYNRFEDIPKNKYKLIYVDPPWSYKNKKTGGSMKSGSSTKYETMALNELKLMKISNIEERESVLFLWATTPLLPDAFEIMKHWRYKYKTAIYWRKIMSLGMGYWFRGQVEVLLMGIKGNIKAFRIQKPNFIQCKVREHSRKPDEFYELIEMTKLMPRIELFARNTRNDWDSFGNELGD